ncbi:MAG: aminodeoxychorismate/anthranilate synthase component II [Deltaproteobacteria bacterium]|nr:aminodeoxychorismate/anthranilate synthase component II [Deltaproteobacteria bacterium]
MNDSNKKLNVLFIDNFDSFVFNLVDEFEKRDCSVTVWRNNISAAQALEIFEKMPKPALIVLSPGPGNPDDAGCCLELVKTAPQNVPFFGVCLGQQIMTQALDGEVVLAGEIVHGKASQINIKKESYIFNGLETPLSVGRYHSLKCNVASSQFTTVADYKDIPMAIVHKTRPLGAVQFHPESVLTPLGGKIIENVIKQTVSFYNNMGE